MAGNAFKYDTKAALESNSRRDTKPDTLLALPNGSFLTPKEHLLSVHATKMVPLRCNRCSATTMALATYLHIGSTMKMNNECERWSLTTLGPLILQSDAIAKLCGCVAGVHT